MDRKSVIVLIVCVLLFVSWPYLVNKVFPPKPAPPGTTNAVALATNQAALGTNIPVLSAATNIPSTAPPPIVTPSAPEELQLIETPEALYTFTTHGGGLKHVALKPYPESREYTVLEQKGAQRPCCTE
jgi:hypothetical protein